MKQHLKSIGFLTKGITSLTAIFLSSALPLMALSSASTDVNEQINAHNIRSSELTETDLCMIDSAKITKARDTYIAITNGMLSDLFAISISDGKQGEVIDHLKAHYEDCSSIYGVNSYLKYHEDQLRPFIIINS